MCSQRRMEPARPPGRGGSLGLGHNALSPESRPQWLKCVCVRRPMPSKVQREAKRKRLAEASRCRDAMVAALGADLRWHRRRDAPGTALAVWHALGSDDDMTSGMTLVQVAARVVKTRGDAEFNARDMLLTSEGRRNGGNVVYIGGKRNSRLHAHVGCTPLWQLQVLLDDTVGMGDDVPYETIVDLVAARGMKDEWHKNLLAWHI